MIPVLLAIVMYYRKFPPPTPPEEDVDYFTDTTQVIDYFPVPEEDFELLQRDNKN